MPNLNFYDRDGTLRSLPLTAIETTAYADFHKRSETTYPDLSITAYDLPIATLTKRDTTVVYWSVSLQGFTSAAALLNQSATRVIDMAIVTPSVSADTSKYDFTNQITFTNDNSSTTFVVLLSGDIPEGLTLETGTVTNSYITFNGNIRDELFGFSLDEYKNLSNHFIINQKSEILELEYIDNLTDKNVLTSPPKTYTTDDVIINIGDGGSQSRAIDSVIRYIESSPTQTTAGSFVVDTEYYITVSGNTDFTAIGASSNAAGTIFTATGVGVGSGKATSEIKNKVVVKTYSLDLINTYEVAINIDPFQLSQKQKFDSNNEELPLDDTWRGYVVDNTGAYAQYKDVKFSNSENDRVIKTYTFILSLYTDSTLATFIDQKTFTLQVKASPEALRSNYLASQGILPQRYLNNVRIQ